MKSKKIIIIIGLLVSAVSLVIVFNKVDFYLFWGILKEVKITPLVLMVVLYLFGFIIRGIRWRIMLKPIKDISIKDTSAFIIIGHAANNILPARLGEFFRAYVVGKKEKISKVFVFGSLAIERVFDGLILLCIFSMTSLLADFSPEYAGIIKKVGVTGSAVFVIALIFVLIARFQKRWVEIPVCKIVKLFPEKIAKIAKEMVDNLINSASFIKFDKNLLYFLFLSVGIWAGEGLIFVIALYALSLPLNLILAFFAVSFTSLGMGIPSAPGYVGLFQGLILMVFLFFGMDSNSALAYSVITHITIVVPPTLLGLILLNFYGMSFVGRDKNNT